MSAAIDLVAISERLNEQHTVVAGVVRREGEAARLRISIQHDDWRVTNLFPSQYERILGALSADAWAIREFTIRQKTREEMDHEADSDFVVAILELEPVETNEVPA